MSEHLGQGNWLLSISKNKALISELTPLFTDKAFVNAISKARTPQAIKDVFTQFHKVDLVKNIPDEFVMTLAKTKNTTNIVNTMNYVEKYESLGPVMKILKQPTMKYV